MTQRYFTEEGIWNGGHYELALEIGQSSDEQLRQTLFVIWEHVLLEGCFPDRDKEPEEQQPVELSRISLESGLHLQGLAYLPGNYTVACGTCLIREENGSDWLVFYLPMASLSKAYDVAGYPFNVDPKSSLPWQITIDNWLSEIGRFVYSKSEYKLGLVGFEVSGQYYAEQIKQNGLPEKRDIGYLWPSGSGITYFPRNK